MLARWLTSAEYGAFAVAFAVFLFLSGFHNALLLEPMSVLGPSRYFQKIEAYLSAQVRLHFTLTLPLALFLTLTGLFLQIRQDVPEMAGALLGSGLALPLILLPWTVRRMFYVLKRPKNAMITSVFYALFLGASLGGMHLYGLDSSFAALLSLGLASLLSSVLTGVGLLAQHGNDVSLSWWEILKAHWDYGKWIVAAAILGVASGQFQTLFLAGSLNLESAGMFRAMQNFMLPMAQAVTAIATLGLPALSYDYGRGDLRSLRRKGLFITLALTGGAIIYAIFLWIFALPIERLVYAGKYSTFAWMIPLLTLVPVFTAAATGPSLVLRTYRPQIHLIGGAVQAVVSLSTTILLVKIWGVGGAAISLVLTYLAVFVFTVYLYRIWCLSYEAKE
uniref:Hypothetical conserved protein n=1 Tax=uncultured Chloroflexota bacterium TaxID=166587 RepID=H5SBC1_9CHLR|nr:hypothetical conserved protein [uncultured Chloroflexota bacterium]